MPIAGVVLDDQQVGTLDWRARRGGVATAAPHDVVAEVTTARRGRC
jgi:hypothetical protein